MPACGCSSTTSLIVGTRPQVAFDFLDASGDPADPTSLTVRVMDPGGAVVEYDQDSPEVSNPTVGTWVWQPASPLLTAGEWWVYVAGSGGGADVAAEDSFVIGDTHVPLGT